MGKGNLWGYIGLKDVSPVMENQMERKRENETESVSSQDPGDVNQ